MEKIKLRANWPAPDNFLIELGRISALWGSLEKQLNLAIGKFAGYEAIYDARAAILLTHSNFKQRVDILGALCDYLKEDYPHLKSHNTVIPLLIKAQTRRNKYMHEGIYLNEDTKKVEMASITARGKLKTSVEEVTMTDLQDVSTVILEAMQALQKLLSQKHIIPI